MALDPRAQAALGLHRFGFGPVRGNLDAIASDPRGAILADIDPSRAKAAGEGLPDSGTAARAIFDFRAEQRAEKKLEDRARKVADAQRMASGGGDMEAAPAAAPPAVAQPKRAPGAPPPLPQKMFLDEAQARIEAVASANIGFAQRLVWFWSNHFCVSADKALAVVGPFEREAIRPHVFGRFADMLAAVESHPAMIFYLDNARSIGPNSLAGINRDKGLNENLAREIMELHTLGVRSGYTQEDVTRFANVLTGWTIVPLNGNPDRGGEFLFNRRMHEPGEQIVLGKHYAENGVAQGRAVLDDLARHPATAKHIARKLAVHFVADEPPQPLVDRLEKTFRDTDGDLKEVSKALLTSPEAWTPERKKLKRPSEWIAAAMRLTGANVPFPRVVRSQALLGEPLWRPPAPNGFSDFDADWIDGLPRRLDLANEYAGRIGADIDPEALLDDSIGPIASQETRDTVARAESRRQAVALLLMTPEFLRR
jgi:uncharacterized protein (DUF1800 family)